MSTKNVFLLFLLISSITFWGCKKGKLPTTIKIKSAYKDSTISEMFRFQNGITAGIGTRSMVLNDGRILWFFENSHLNDWNANSQKIPCNETVKNAAMVQSGNSFNVLNVGTNDFIPSNQIGTWFVPLHAYQYFDTVFVFAKKEGSSPNFKTYIAKYQFPSLTYLKTDSVSFNNTVFGYNVIVDTPVGFCYVYGLRSPNSSSLNDVVIGRFPMNNINSTWEFYNKNEWLHFAQNGEVITSIPAENFSISKIKNWYVLITQDKEFKCNATSSIYSKTAAYPFGPFLNESKIYTIPEKFNTIAIASKSATIHPQFTLNDELLITYAVNGYQPCVITCSNNEVDADFYRVKAIRIPLKTINPGM